LQDADSDTTLVAYLEDTDVMNVRENFPVVYIQKGPEVRPSELSWLLNEIGMLTGKLNALLTEINERMELACHLARNGQSDSQIEMTPRKAIANATANPNS